MATIPDPTFLKCFQKHRLGINWIAFSPNSQYLASASADHNVMLWTLNEANSMCFKYSGHKDSVTTVALTNSFMISGSKDCTARMWMVDKIEGVNYSAESSVYRCHQSPINSVDINLDETQFCTASDDKTVRLWSTSSTNKMLTSLSGEHTNWVRHARFSKLSPYLLSSCGDDGVICIWDTRTKEAAIRLKSRRKSTHFVGVQWHPTCEYIMSSSSSDNLIRIWDLRYEKSIQCYQVHDGVVTSTDFHPNGNYLISSSSDQTCKILDLYEGRTLFTIKAHSNQVNCAQFSPRGDYFATSGQDRVLLYWRSNLPEYNAADSSEEDDIRSISIDPEPINSFNPVDRSLAKRINKVSLNDHVSNSSADSPTKTDKNHRTESPLNGDVDSLDSKEDSGSLDSSNSVSILKCILQQLESITDSILNIDQRLYTLERKFDKR